MPAVGADALHLAGIGGAGGLAMHHGRPVVIVPALWQGKAILVVIIVRIRFAVGRVACGNSGAVGITRGAQIRPHPALVANLYGAVNVAVYVHHYRCTRAGFLVNSAPLIDGQFQRIFTRTTIDVLVSVCVSAAFGVCLSMPGIAVASRYGIHSVCALKLSTTGGNVIHATHGKRGTFVSNIVIRK